MTVSLPPASDSEDRDSTLPIQVEFYIDPDGSVVFADLAADVLPLAYELNPDQPLVCDVPASARDGSAGKDEQDA